MEDRFVQARGGLIQLVVHFLVVDQSSDGALALVDLDADGAEVGGGDGDVAERFLTAVQDGVGFLDEVRDRQGRLAGDGVAVLDTQTQRGAKRYGDKFIAQQALGLDGGYRVLLDDGVG